MRFNALRETLLKGGIAPRHVRRYLNELCEHLDDLTAEQRQAGYDEEEAAIRARALLGDDTELARAMLKDPRFKSWAARLPWLVFVALPPVVTIIAITPVFLLFYFTGDAAHSISAATAIPQGWVQGAAGMALGTLNILAVPMVATAFAVLARRQRLALLWPLLGIALLMLLMPQFGYRFGYPDLHQKGMVSVGMGLALLSTAWNHIVAHWPNIAAQYLLSLLPVAWLIRAHKQTT